jgi:hypothetical protein
MLLVYITRYWDVHFIHDMHLYTAILSACAALHRLERPLQWEGMRDEVVEVEHSFVGQCVDASRPSIVVTVDEF